MTASDLDGHASYYIGCLGTDIMTDPSQNTHTTSAALHDDKTLLKITGLKKTYDQTEVLKDINLDIKHGEFLTLLSTR